MQILVNWLTNILILQFNFEFIVVNVSFENAKYFNHQPLYFTILCILQLYFQYYLLTLLTILHIFPYHIYHHKYLCNIIYITRERKLNILWFDSRSPWNTKMTIEWNLFMWNSFAIARSFATPTHAKLSIGFLVLCLCKIIGKWEVLVSTFSLRSFNFVWKSQLSRTLLNF